MRNISNYDLILIVLGISAAFCLSPIVADLATVVLWTFIGAPLVLIPASIPTLFLFLLLARLAHFGLGLIGVRFWPLGGVVGLGLLAVLPAIENQRLNNIAQELIADDRNEVSQPVVIGTLAVVTTSQRSRDHECDDLCQRVLLAGRPSRVLMINAPAPLPAQLETLTGKLFYLEQRPACPDIELRNSINRIEFQSEKTTVQGLQPADMLRLMISSGDCVVSEPASLSEADAVLAIGEIKVGETVLSAGLNPFVDTVSASRLKFFLRENGRLVERYRLTGTTTKELYPILIPTYTDSKQLRKLSPALLRRTAVSGAAKRFRPTPPIQPFLEDVLGLNLRISEAKRNLKVNDTIARILRQPGVIADNDLELISRFLKRAGSVLDRSVEDAELALEIFRDRRVPATSPNAHSTFSLVVDHSQLTAQFADDLFSRLSELADLQRKDGRISQRQDFHALVSVVPRLPDVAVLPHKAMLLEIAGSPKLYLKFHLLLTRLSAFGVETIPVIFRVLDEVAEIDLGDKDRQAKIHAYKSAMIALCRIGPEGREGIDMLYARIHAGKAMLFGSHWDLTIHTLIKLGAEPDEIWSHLKTAQPKHRTREHFNVAVETAARPRNLCS